MSRYHRDWPHDSRHMRKRPLAEVRLRDHSTMETLLRQDDSPGLTVEKQFGAAEVGDQHLEIFEGDAGRVVAEGGGFVVPGARVEEVLGIGMESQVPIEIA